LFSTERSVHFDFDNFLVKNASQSPIERHGRCLRSPLKLAIRIEGITDERGSAQPTKLSLGLKRVERHDGTAGAQSRRADLTGARPWPGPGR